MSHEFDQQEAGSSVYELITGLFCWTKETWIDPNFSLEKNTQKIQKLSGPLLEAKTAMDALYGAMSAKIIGRDKPFPQFDLPLRPTLDVMPWGPSSDELKVKLFKGKKNVGRGQIKFFNKQPIDKYMVQSNMENGGIHCEYPEEPRKDKMWFSYFYWNSPLRISRETEMHGEISYIMYAFARHPGKLEDNSEASRIYALYKGVHIARSNESGGTGLRLNEFGSERSGFFKMKEMPFINQKFIDFQSVKLPLYTSLPGGTPWIA